MRRAGDVRLLGRHIPAYGKSQFFNVRRVAGALLDVLGLWYRLVLRREHLVAAGPSPVERPLIDQPPLDRAPGRSEDRAR